MNPYHVPFHLKTEFEENEIEKLLKECQRIDPYLTGNIQENNLNAILEEIDEDSEHDRIVASIGKDDLTFLKVIKEIGKIRRKREPFGGRRVIHDDVPLPSCCINGACAAHIERPPPDDCPMDEVTSVLLTIFKRHDQDGSGALEMEEIPQILEENGVSIDDGELQTFFDRYDADGGGTLDFKEFSTMLKDMKVAAQIAMKRQATYDLPPTLKKAFTEEEIQDFKLNFGMFDANGDGNIDQEELLTILNNMGQDCNPEQVQEVIAEIDYDQSGAIEFVEFVTLMHKVREGKVDLGTSIFAQAVMDSKPAKVLKSEVTKLEENPVNGCSIEILRESPTTCICYIDGPGETPYEGGLFRLEVKIPDSYPYEAPHVRFVHRVFHLNIHMLLDGTCTLPGLMKLWDASWNLRTLLEAILEILAEPDPSLLPDDLNESSGQQASQKTAHNGRSTKSSSANEEDADVKADEEDTEQDDELADGWEAVYDEDSDMTYYWNSETGESVWEKPLKEKPEEPDLAEVKENDAEEAVEEPLEEEHDLDEEEPSTDAATKKDETSETSKRSKRTSQAVQRLKKLAGQDLREKKQGVDVVSRTYQLFYYQRQNYDRLAKQFTLQYAKPLEGKKGSR